MISLEKLKEERAKKVFEEYLNLSSAVNHTFFIKHPNLESLHCFTEKAMYKGKLKQLESDYDEYHHYIQKYKRNVIEVIKDFELNIPLADLLSRLHWVTPRKYSVALHH